MSDTEKQQANVIQTNTVDNEKGSYERQSVASESGAGSHVDLANYYEEKAGSLVVDPE